MATPYHWELSEVTKFFMDCSPVRVLVESGLQDNLDVETLRTAAEWRAEADMRCRAERENVYDHGGRWNDETRRCEIDFDIACYAHLTACRRIEKRAIEFGLWKPEPEIEDD